MEKWNTTKFQNKTIIFRGWICLPSVRNWKYMKIDMKRLEILGLSMWILEDNNTKKEEARVSRLDPCGQERSYVLT
jgi:hypothetical protein